MTAQTSTNVAQSAFVCQLCDQKSVMWKCEECSLFICSTCKAKIHPRIKSSDKHRVVSIKDVWKKNEPWYHGKMTRLEAEHLLQKYKDMGDGAFLVRESATLIGNYTVSFLIHGDPMHALIATKEEPGQLQYYLNFLNEEMFDSLYDFIEFLKHDTHTFNIGGTTTEFSLTKPIPKEIKRVN